MVETLDLFESLKQRFKTKKVQPYGKVILVPSKLFDPSWEATLEAEGHKVFVNAMNGQPFCFISVRKNKPRHADSPKASASSTNPSTPTIPQELFVGQKPQAQIKKSPLQERFPQGRLIQVPTEFLKHSTTNPREHFKEADLQALAATIKRHGLLQPILVKQAHDSYNCEVVVGERRLRACKIAGLQTIPCIVLDDLDQEQLLEMQLVENLQRENLTIYEEIKVVRVLKELGLSDKEIGVRCGMSHGRAGQLVYLSRHLPKEYLRQIASGRTRTHNKYAFTQQKALAIAKAKLPPDELRDIVRLITNEGLTYSSLTRKLAEKPKKKIERVFSDASKQYWNQLVKKLREFARYWKDICEIEEWEDEKSEYYIHTPGQVH